MMGHNRKTAHTVHGEDVQRSGQRDPEMVMRHGGRSLWPDQERPGSDPVHGARIPNVFLGMEVHLRCPNSLKPWRAINLRRKEAIPYLAGAPCPGKGEKCHRRNPASELPDRGGQESGPVLNTIFLASFLEFGVKVWRKGPLSFYQVPVFVFEIGSLEEKLQIFRDFLSLMSPAGI